MTSLETRLTFLSPYFLALLRVVVGLLFLSHGTMKLFGMPPSEFQPPLLSLFGLAAVIEIVGSLLIIFGAFTRPVAFILSGEMAVAYFVAHAPQDFFPILNGGESAILFCFVFLYLVFAGAGAISVDGLRSAPVTPAAQRVG